MHPGLRLPAQEREEFAVSPLDLQATRKADENLWRK